MERGRARRRCRRLVAPSAAAIHDVVSDREAQGHAEELLPGAKVAEGEHASVELRRSGLGGGGSSSRGRGGAVASAASVSAACAAGLDGLGVDADAGVGLAEAGDACLFDFSSERKLRKKAESASENEKANRMNVDSLFSSLSLSPRALFGVRQSLPLAMSQLTNSARASFSASMGSLGGAAATRLADSRADASDVCAVVVWTSIDSAASAAAARGSANGGSVRGGIGVDLPLVGGVQSRLFGWCCCWSGDEGQLLLLLLLAAAAAALRPEASM